MIVYGLTGHDTTLLVATIGGAFGLVSTALSSWIIVKVREVHQLTNSRLKRIEAQLSTMTDERNQLQREVDLAVPPPARRSTDTRPPG